MALCSPTGQQLGRSGQPYRVPPTWEFTGLWGNQPLFLSFDIAPGRVGRSLGFTGPQQAGTGRGVVGSGGRPRGGVPPPPPVPPE